MKTLQGFCFATLIAFSAGLAAAEPQEELAQAHLKVMERFVEILNAVKDVASAKQYKAELQSLSAANKATFQKANELKLSRDAMIKYLQVNYRDRSNAIFGGMFGAMSKMSTVPEFEAIGEHIGPEVNALSKGTWASFSASSKN